jgi:hypothetical protein
MHFDRSEYQHVACTDHAEIERNAYNAAFRELGLRWHWDADTYQELRRLPEEMQRIGAYLQSHQSNLLRAYGSEFLSALIYATKSQCQMAANRIAPLDNGFDDVH